MKNQLDKIYAYIPEDDIVGTASTKKGLPHQFVNTKYVKEDAFIDKLECWMNENFYQYAGEFAEGILAQFDRTEDAIDSFRKYIKGE